MSAIERIVADQFVENSDNDSKTGFYELKRSFYKKVINL